MPTQRVLPTPARLATLTPIAAACLALPAAWAQGAAAPAATGASAPAAASQSVVVTGYQSSLARGLELKRDADRITDTVSSDDVGKLPDFNAADALKRVTGVSTLAYQGEPRYVVIRGLDANYNTTLIDGFSVASPDTGTRQMLMEVLPSNFVSRIDVTKSFLPEDDGGSIGGTANLVTADGWAFKDNSLLLSAKGGQTLGDKRYGARKPIGEAAARWAKRFGAHDEFAFVGTASWWTRHLNVPQIESGGALNWYDSAGHLVSTPYGGNGFAVPTERRWYNYDNLRTRNGLTARLDWAPGGALSGHLSAYSFDQHEISNRNTEDAQVQSTSVVSNQTATRGTLTNVQQFVELGRLRWQRRLSGLNGELFADLTPDWTANLRGSVSRATSVNPQTWDHFVQGGLTYAYDWSAPTPAFTAATASANNPADYPIAYHEFEQTDYTSKVTDLQFNLRRHMDDDARGWGTAFGSRLLTTDVDQTYGNTIWNWTAATAPYTLAGVAGAGLCGFHCTDAMMTVDPRAADAALAQNAASARLTSDAGLSKTYSVSEHVAAAYGELQYRARHALVTGGLRVETTNFDTWGYTSGKQVRANDHYTDWLPSLGGFVDTGKHTKLRFGLSRTLGRPSFAQAGLVGGSLSTTSSPPTLAQGNPALKARTSDNADLSNEWYFDDNLSMLSVGVFYKRIRNEIFSYGQLQDVGGVQTLVTEARNTDGLVRTRGLEFGLQKDLGRVVPALQGFAIAANLTLLRSHYPVTLGDGSGLTLDALPEQPHQMWNATLIYERGALHTRLAWNHLGALWDDRFPNYSSQAQFYRNRFQQATDNVDLQAAYDLSRRLTLTIDAMNLTGQGFEYRFGRSQEYVQSTWSLPSSILVGFNYHL